jgi:hypothetical protein
VLSSAYAIWDASSPVEEIVKRMREVGVSDYEMYKVYYGIHVVSR